MENLEVNVTLEWTSERGPVQVPNRRQAAEELKAAVEEANKDSSNSQIVVIEGSEGSFEIDGLAVVKALLGSLYDESRDTQGHKIRMK